MASGEPPFSFTQPFFWSTLKLEILEKYANALAGIMGGKRRMVFVDLMAGEGYPIHFGWLNAV